MTPRRGRRARAPLALWISLAALGPARAELPPENQCPTVQASATRGAAEDAAPLLLEPGLKVSIEGLPRIAELFPPEIWSNRSEFFSPGMQLEIGPCHRRYPVADSFAAATERYAGTTSLDAAGNLVDYHAGLPFRPSQIDSSAPDAGARWAWNAAYHWRGAGPVGRFRLSDLLPNSARPLVYAGLFFVLQTGHRADLPAPEHAVPEASGSSFVAGGRFSAPFDARELAWRQIRPLAADQSASEPDDTFVYVPTMRKMRRAATAVVDGMFVPRYTAAGDDGGGSISLGGGGLPGGAIAPRAATSAAVTQHVRRGFTTLLFRPNAYRWRLVAERAVLAPINVAAGGYPQVPDRNFGRSGLSLASDRWDLRHAVVIEGRPREAGGNFDRLVLWIDYQTQLPLFAMTHRRAQIADVAIAAHRYSGDVPGYPESRDGERALVFDPVAEVGYSPSDRSGWRRESYDLRSLPLPSSEIRRYTSSAFLERGH
jgi:hypothetical protein